ncbi:MAG TPA: S-layer protein domain-containing protein [Methanotrichaceae archaeon]|nr:S-layer protein domain-containing protein [Methanotrichaceae archaeon]
MTAITLTAMMVLLATASIVGAVDTVQIRGQVATGDFTWNPQNFAGFYYDIKNDLGTETLTTKLTDVNRLSGDSPYGVTYQTTAQSKKFAFDDWGYYKVIGYLANRYFASYIESANESPLVSETTDKNQLSSEQLLQVLTDDDTEMTISSATPLKLAEGYSLAIKSIDVKGNKVYLELSKDGAVVDSKVISPSADYATMSDKTYYYQKATVGDAKKVVIIAVHFKNAFAGADQNLATIDGEWQLSDTPVSVKADTTYDKMTVRTVDASALTITMDNKDNAITLSKNKDLSLMPGIRIQTADNDTLRYYVYKQITEPGTYELRGAVATGDFSWNPQNFAGFFYDIKKDIGTETLTTKLTEGNKLSGDAPYGITYQSTAQSKDYEFGDWGSYYVMGFMAKKYFAAYNEKQTATPMVAQTTDKNQLSSEQLLEVLTDDDTEMTITSGTPLKLAEGYALAIKSIDVDGNKVYLELTKDGAAVDDKVIQPSKSNATMADKTYYYKKATVGDASKVVIIAVHFKNAFRGADQDLATVDGEWQLSDTPVSVKSDTSYDKMTIRTIDANAMTITMDNKDNAVTLSKNKNIDLMPGVSIKTADNDTLRYYIYTEQTIEGAAAAPAANVTAPAANVTAPVVPANETVPAEVTPVTTTNVTTETKTTNVTTETKTTNETTPAPAQQPGFEGIFAITGLMAVAYLVLGRKQ